MKKKQFVLLGLTEELATRAAAASAEELKEYIPKMRFDEVNNAKKVAEAKLIELQKQIADLELKAIQFVALSSKIDYLQEVNQLFKEKCNTDVKDLSQQSHLNRSSLNSSLELDLVIQMLHQFKLEREYKDITK